MSTTGIESVLTRAMSDAAFADQLFANPDQALIIGFELTAEETSKLKGLSRTEFDTLASSPEERKSFGAVIQERGGRNHNQTALNIHK